MLKSFLQFPKQAFNRYNRALLESPYKTKMATAGFAFFVADVICQRFIEHKKGNDYSINRTLRQSFVGTFVSGPSLHVGHTMIIPNITKYFATRPAKVLVSMLISETMFNLYFACTLLFCFEFIRTMSVDSSLKEVELKVWSAFWNSMKFWPFVNIVSFSVVPVHFRPLFINFFSIIWQTYLSYVSNNKPVDLSALVVEAEKEIVSDPEVTKD